MSLHIIAGILKSRILKAPKGPQTRPSTALLRKALFDRLAPYIEEAHFLDIFAGSGAMGIEALSRGATKATFIERDKEALRCIYENLENLKISPQATVLPMDVERGLKLLQKKKEMFDVVYCDPPYRQKEDLVTTLKFLDSASILKEKALIFLEEEEPSFAELKNLKTDNIRWQDTRQFGKALLHRYIYEPFPV